MIGINIRTCNLVDTGFDFLELDRSTKIGMSQQETDPLEIIYQQRSSQRRLCDRLEAVADLLPVKPDKMALGEIYDQLKRRIPVFNRNEEALFSILAKNNLGFPNLPEIITQSGEEHRMHDTFADEFYEVFFEAATDFPDTARGYMLRFFFATITRHLDWEDLILMPLAKNDLPKTDWENLANAISNNAAGG